MYLVSNFCNPVSANELTSELDFSSVNTTKKYMDYLHEPYLFYYLSRYNNKLKLMKKAPRKVYVVDNGFVASKAFSLSDNLGRLLENQVFIELIRRGYERPCFIIVHGMIKKLILSFVKDHAYYALSRYVMI